MGRQITTRAIVDPTSGTAVRGGSLVAVRIMLDGLAIAVALGFAAALRFTLGLFEVTEATPPTVKAHAAASVLWLGSLLGACALNRLYDEDTLFPGGGELARVVRSAVEASAILSVFVFLTQSFYVSRSWFVLTIVLSTTVVAVERVGMRAVLRAGRIAGKHRRPAILVSRSETWEEWPFEEEHEFHVAARVNPEEFERFVAEVQADEGRAVGLTGAAVVLRARDFSHDEFWRILLLAGEKGWSVFVHSPVRSVGRDRLTVRELAGQTIVKVAPPILTGPRAVQKRALDLVLSGIFLIILTPVFIAIGLAIALTSGFPVFYRQERVSRGVRTFTMMKFRTMTRGSEAESGPVMASVDDPRRTPLGRWLRRTSLDELPQLFNVLVGDMSLVGPRPERPSFVADLEKEMTWYRFRHRIRPGLTGWAQSHGLRGNTSLESRVQYDNWYIENWSVWLDLKILIMTAREVMKGRNAY